MSHPTCYVTFPQIILIILFTLSLFQLPIYDPLLKTRRTEREAHVICYLRDIYDNTFCDIEGDDCTQITNLNYSIECHFTTQEAPIMIFNHSELSRYISEEVANAKMQSVYTMWGGGYDFRYYYGDEEDLTEERALGLVDQWGLSFFPLPRSSYYYRNYYGIIFIILIYFTMLFIFINAIYDNYEWETEGKKLKKLKSTIRKEEKIVSQ